MAIGTLTVNVAANVSNALRGFDRFGNKLTKTQRRMRGFAKRLVSLRNVVGGIAAIGGLTISFRGLKSVAEDLDEIAKTATRLGEDPGRLQALSRGAELSGASIEKLNTGLLAMTRRISEAAIGEGEARGALEDLGLSAERLNRLSPVDQLRAIADGMQAIDVQADRVRVSMDLFSRGAGAEMVNVLQGGSGALDEMTDRFDKFGRRFSKEELSNVEQFNDAWGDITTSFKSLGQIAVVDLAPALKGAAEAMGRFIQNGDAAKSLKAIADSINAIKDAASFFGRGIRFGQGVIQEGLLAGEAGLQALGAEPFFRREDFNPELARQTSLMRREAAILDQLLEQAKADDGLAIPR